MLSNIILPWTSFHCIKVPFLLLASMTYYLGMKAPNPPPSDKTNVYRGQIFEHIVRAEVILGQVTTIVPLLSECIIILALNKPNPHSTRVIANICPRAAPTLPIDIPTLSTVFCVGVAAMISGAALRMWCYSTLGKMFTYEVSIQPKHELVTSGPYSFIRHPSYTGAGLMVTGAAITCLAPGSFIHECNILATPIKWIVALWLSMAVFTFASLRRRGEVEDEGLRKAFGEAWHRYSQAVPYQFIPYLF